jgi:voltage-gated potassium channel Kch
MKSFKLRDRLRYRFDNFMARGTSSLILGLGLVSLVFVLIGGLVVVGLALKNGETGYDLPEALWAALMRTMDSGGMGGDEGWSFRAVMFIVTIGGIFVFSALIGVLTTALDARLEELRKGRSQVVEKGHTVILGWTPEIFPVIEQLVEANSNRKNQRIAILADLDKVEMEDEIARRVGDLRTTKVVCRSGSPIDIDDVGLVNIAEARSVIVLSGKEEDADSSVVKTLLAASKRGLAEGPAGKAVVARIRDESFLQPAEIASGGRIVPILVDRIIPRVVAQTCRQSGLSNVYVELLDFQGSEIYFAPATAFVGKTFHEAVLGYADCAVIGLVSPDGATMVNPPMATRIGEGWKVIAVAEDDDKISPLASPPPVDGKLIVAGRGGREPKERFLVLGWNDRVDAIVGELDAYVAKGSTVKVVGASEEGKAALAGLSGSLRNLKASYQTADITSREVLEKLDLGKVDHLIVMCEDGDYEAEAADSRTLVTLIHVRDIAKKGGFSFSLTSQILDIRNRALAEVAEADDFIVSDRILSLMVAQLSENPGLRDVLADLFDPEGSEVYIKPASDYVRLGEAVDFYTVAESCARRGHCAIGYRVAARAKEASAAYGVMVNPRKADSLVFHEGDGIVVLAQD